MPDPRTGHQWLIDPAGNRWKVVDYNAAVHLPTSLCTCGLTDEQVVRARGENTTQGPET